MKIILFGAAGQVGSRIMAEAIMRKHKVTAIVRNPHQFNSLPKTVHPLLVNVGTTDNLDQAITGHDIVISAIRPKDGYEKQLVPLTKAIVNGASKANVRILIVGGAASLKMPNKDDTTVLTEPGFLPKGLLDIAHACFDQYEFFQSEMLSGWTYVSPPTQLSPGIRTGTYRLGLDELLMDENGISYISMEDFSVALIDEAERPKHPQMRFTVASKSLNH